ncbi:hypothetical protein ABH968_000847 [Lysinibacillus sp. RC79]
MGDSSGISVTDETLQRSEAAHRTPPGKRPAGTEINPHFADEAHFIKKNEKHLE